MEEFGLTEEQLKAAKAVNRAIRIAGKLGVRFWDDYGKIKAINGNKITLPVPDENNEFELTEHDGVAYWENLPEGYFNSGNADDPLFYNRV